MVVVVDQAQLQAAGRQAAGGGGVVCGGGIIKGWAGVGTGREWSRRKEEGRWQEVVGVGNGGTRWWDAVGGVCRGRKVVGQEPVAEEGRYVWCVNGERRKEVGEGLWWRGEMVYVEGL